MYIYDYAKQIHQLEAILENSDDEGLADALNELQLDEREKMLALAKWAQELDAETRALAEAAGRIEIRMQQQAKKCTSVFDMLHKYMVFRNIPSVQDEQILAKVQKNPASVVITDEAALPAEYKKQAEPPAPKPDKAAIKEALQAGKKVPGAYLDDKKTRLVVK